MCDINTPTFDKPRDFIRTLRQNQKSWDEIRTFKTSNCDSTAAWIIIKCEEEFWPNELINEPQVWGELVNSLEQAENQQLIQSEIQFTGAESGMLTESEDPNFTIPEGEESAWQHYREHLARKSFPEATIDSIEAECFKTLKCLKRHNVEVKQPVKGLVVGHVQSGKTANMAGLMSMAADWGFDMFIVLTGTIENLRKQTQSRLLTDLNHVDKGCIQSWFSLHHLNSHQAEHRAIDFTFGGPTNHLTVSIKNRSRLEKLANWLNEFPERLATMNILIIDDESDQAGVNTRTDEERTAINQCILNLTELQSKSLNYVAYTATPYANVLNEAEIDSLYPSSFIRTLPLNRSYFGPELIFGTSPIDDSSGAEGVASLDIVREIPAEDIESINDIHIGEAPGTPESFKDAVAWFLCGTAARRADSATDPTSMLVHTSQRQDHHREIAKEIRSLFTKDNANALKSACKEIWERETKRFSLDAFNTQYKDYEGTAKDYPQWSEIEKEIDELIRGQLQHIQLTEEGDIEYSRSIHLCIDNCANNRVDEEGQLLRLFYPKEPLEYSAAFIVVGGATLSRGLTIEGLVSTYFLRTSRLGDSLMQMGRWFGYRRGYELLPRVWMSQNTQDQFAYLAAIEADLREEVKIYERTGMKPSQFGPKIGHWAPNLLTITARNKMQAAHATEFDFSGIRNENTIFYKATEILLENLQATQKFLEKITCKQALETPRGRGLVFRRIDFEKVRDYLSSMNFHPRSRVFAEISMFVNWFEEIQQADDPPYELWNVIVSSLRGVEDWKPEHESDPNRWQLAGKALKKVNRSQQKKFSSPDALSIGSLQDPMDKFLDLPDEYMPDKAPRESVAVEIREKAGMKNVPQLIIYRINGKTNIPNLGENRANLDLDSDLIGLLIRIPGKRNESLVRTIQVAIPKDADPEESPDVNNADTTAIKEGN